MTTATGVSVVILNHNYGRFLPTAIAGALGQSRPPTQVVVVDDASTDDSREVIESFGLSIETVFHDVNRGQGAAINSGAAAATGDVVWFLDADDALLPQACEVAAAAFEADPGLAKFHTPLAVIDGAGRWSGDLLPSDPSRLAAGDIGDHVLRFRNHGWPPMSGNAYAASALRRVLPIPEDTYRQAADSFLNEQVAICGPLARAAEPVAAYRIHGRNQFAGRPVGLDWLRTKIERELCSHQRLGHVALHRDRPDYDPDPAAAKDIAFIGYRLASLRLDPEGHPSVGAGRPDTRFSLIGDGLDAAYANDELPMIDRVLRSLWFVTVGLAPARAVPGLLGWYMPDGPSPPVWRRWRRRPRRQRTHTTTATVLVEPVSTEQAPGMEDRNMADNNESDTPTVTIVVTPRERFGLSRAALESIYAHT
ncbi:MAG: glycosyltransferase family 2 protein, partial [Acidimicrobiales bacterium]